MTRRVVVGLFLLGACAMFAQVQELSNIQIHGFAAQGLLYSLATTDLFGRACSASPEEESGAPDFVRSNDNGIGYVSANADTTGVKIVTVTEY